MRSIEDIIIWVDGILMEYLTPSISALRFSLQALLDVGAKKHWALEERKPLNRERERLHWELALLKNCSWFSQCSCTIPDCLRSSSWHLQLCYEAVTFSFVFLKFFLCLGYPKDYFVVRASFLINSSYSKEIQCVAHTASSWVFEKYFERFVKLIVIFWNRLNLIITEWK